MRGIIALDIDGTLTHKREWIDPAIFSHLALLAKDNWQIVFLTGRMFSFAKKILEPSPFPYILASQNGADLVEMPSGKVIRSHYMHAGHISAIDAAYQGIEEDFIIYAGLERGDFCYFRPHRYSSKMLAYLKKLESLGSTPWAHSTFAFEPHDSFPLVKGIGLYEGMRRVQERLSPHPELEVSLIADPFSKGEYYLNLITHAKAHKGETVRFLRGHLKAPLVIAAGNDFNDLKMLKEADIAIAIAGSPQDLLNEADYIAADPAELGILAALKQAIS